VNAAGVAEAIREALGSRGQFEQHKGDGDRAVQLGLKTTAEGIARVFEISVEERG
jgi:hypothetical protein